MSVVTNAIAILAVLLLYTLIPVVTISPALLASGWMIHKVVRRDKQKLFAQVMVPILYVLWILVFTRISGKPVHVMLLKAACIGIVGGPMMALYFGKIWPQVQPQGGAAPIGSQGSSTSEKNP